VVIERSEVLLFDFLKIYIILSRTACGRMALIRARRLLRLRLLLVIFSHPIPHVPELLPHLTRRPEYWHQEVEHESVQQIENNDEK
jgi:hypothetical protein